MLEGQKVIVGFGDPIRLLSISEKIQFFQLNSVWLSVACITVDWFIELSQET